MKLLYKSHIYESVDPNPLKGGIGDNVKVDDKELAKGTEIEKEHVGSLDTAENVAIASDIARDHIAEFPNYYEKLEKMEDKLEKEKKNA